MFWNLNPTLVSLYSYHRHHSWQGHSRIRLCSTHRLFCLQFHPKPEKPEKKLLLYNSYAKTKNETIIKAKLKKQTNNDKYRVAANKMDI